MKNLVYQRHIVCEKLLNILQVVLNNTDEHSLTNVHRSLLYLENGAKYAKSWRHQQKPNFSAWTCFKWEFLSTT